MGTARRDVENGGTTKRRNEERRNEGDAERLCFDGVSGAVLLGERRRTRSRVTTPNAKPSSPDA
jgi:hypothetical protein